MASRLSDEDLRELRELERYPSADASPKEQDGDSSSSAKRMFSSPESFDSEDSQAVLVEGPSSQSGLLEQKRDSTPQERKLQRSQSSYEPKKCWICFSDETEDTPTSSRWRSPCPCALKAHEACLLDWIADLESPGRQPKPIKCPQCKSQIQIQRPLSIITPFVLEAHASAVKLTLPFIVASVAGTVVTGLWVHGFCTIFITFGNQDANRLLGLNLLPSRLDSTWSLGMPLIPLGLIAMRTDSPSFEHMLAILPAAYFYVCRDTLLTWPPSPATTLATFGWAQLAYRNLYRRFLTPLEQKWIKERRPRANDTQETGDNRDEEGEHHEVAEGMDVGFEVHIEMDDAEFPEDDAAQDQQGQENLQGDPQEVPANGGPEGEAVPGPNAQGQPPPAGAAAAPAQDRWEHMLDINIVGVVQKAMGALLFPTIAAAMGQGLKTILPRTWTTPPIRGLDKYPPGFLQSRFGRTLVGGCLFVVLKDALQFYSTWQLATSQRHRRVLNYDEIPQRLRQRASRE